MKIKTQMAVSGVFFVILLISIIFSVCYSSNQIQDIQRKQQLLDTVDKSASELSNLENDYLLHGEKFTADRWNTRYAALNGEIQGISSSDPAQQAVISKISGNLKDLNTSFNNLVAVTDQPQGSVPATTIQERKDFFSGTLTGQTQALMSSSTELTEMVNTEALEVEQRSILIISLAIVGLMVFVLLNFLIINRSLIRSVANLSRGAERIGTGDLDTKIEITSNDELGDLTLAFNRMSTNLSESRTLLVSANVALEEAIDRHMQIQKTLQDSERTLRINEERLLMSQEMGHIGSWEYDLKSNTIWGSAEGRRIFGYPSVAGDFPIAEIEACIPEREVVHQALVDLITSGKTYDLEYHIHPSDGSESKVVHSIARLEQDSAGTPLRVRGVIQDITKRRQTEETLRVAYERLAAGEEELRAQYDMLSDNERKIQESEERYRTYIDNSPLGVFTVDSAGNCKDANPAGCLMLGYSREEILSLPIVDRTNSGSGDGSLSSAFLKLKATGSIGIEVELVKKDRELLPVILNAVRLSDDRYLGFCLDITERKQAGQALAAARKKLSVLSTITNQDIQSAAFSLSAYLNLIKKENTDEKVRDYLEKETVLIQSIVKSLNFAKDYQDLGMQEPRWQNVEEIFIYAVSHLKFLDVTRTISLNSLEIYADSHLEKALFHIMQNTVKYGVRATEVRIYYQEHGESIRIIIEDNGVGIPRQEKEQIFERGYGKGSGFGLFLVREILSITGMMIRETGQEGEGARFEITVPKGAYRFPESP